MVRGWSTCFIRRGGGSRASSASLLLDCEALEDGGRLFFDMPVERKAATASRLSKEKSEQIKREISPHGQVELNQAAWRGCALCFLGATQLDWAQTSATRAEGSCFEKRIEKDSPLQPKLFCDFVCQILTVEDCLVACHQGYLELANNFWFKVTTLFLTCK